MLKYTQQKSKGQVYMISTKLNFEQLHKEIKHRFLKTVIRNMLIIWVEMKSLKIFFLKYAILNFVTNMFSTQNLGFWIW